MNEESTIDNRKSAELDQRRLPIRELPIADCRLLIRDCRLIVDCQSSILRSSITDHRSSIR